MWKICWKCVLFHTFRSACSAFILWFFSLFLFVVHVVIYTFIDIFPFLLCGSVWEWECVCVWIRILLWNVFRMHIEIHGKNRANEDVERREKNPNQKFNFFGGESRDRIAQNRQKARKKMENEKKAMKWTEEVWMRWGAGSGAQWTYGEETRHIKILSVAVFFRSMIRRHLLHRRRVCGIFLFCQHSRRSCGSVSIWSAAAYAHWALHANTVACGPRWSVSSAMP